MSSHCLILGFPGGSEVKASACNAGDLSLIPGSGRSPGGGNGNTLQYSCLENPMDGGAWWATVPGVAESDTTEGYMGMGKVNSLDCKEIQPVHPKGDQSWVFIGRTDAEAETPILLPGKSHGRRSPVGCSPWDC